MKKTDKDEVNLDKAIDIWYECYNSIKGERDYELEDKEAAIDFIINVLESREKKGQEDGIKNKCKLIKEAAEQNFREGLMRATEKIGGFRTTCGYGDLNGLRNTLVSEMQKAILQEIKNGKDTRRTS